MLNNNTNYFCLHYILPFKWLCITNKPMPHPMMPMFQPWPPPTTTTNNNDHDHQQPQQPQQMTMTTQRHHHQWWQRQPNGLVYRTGTTMTTNAHHHPNMFTTTSTRPPPSLCAQWWHTPPPLTPPLSTPRMMTDGHIGTLQCTKSYDSWNAYTVLNDMDSWGPVNLWILYQIGIEWLTGCICRWHGYQPGVFQIRSIPGL